jgi:hypothetical protein
LLEPLIIYDPTETYGSEYLICLNGEAKYGYLQAEEDTNLALVDVGVLSTLAGSLAGFVQ